MITPPGDPVDARVTYDWEADRLNRLANHILFWGWYVPVEVAGNLRRKRPSPRSRLRSASTMALEAIENHDRVPVGSRSW
jgi:hypothetical protein